MAGDLARRVEVAAGDSGDGIGGAGGGGSAETRTAGVAQFQRVVQACIEYTPHPSLDPYI